MSESQWNEIGLKRINFLCHREVCEKRVHQTFVGLLRIGKKERKYQISIEEQKLHILRKENWDLLNTFIFTPEFVTCFFLSYGSAVLTCNFYVLSRILGESQNFFSSVIFLLCFLSIDFLFEFNKKRRSATITFVYTFLEVWHSIGVLKRNLQRISSVFRINPC